MRRPALAALCSLLAAAPVAAAEPRFDDDGWYRWEVASGSSGHNACCHQIRNGKVLQTGCDLGVGINEFTIEEDCVVNLDAVQIFAEVRNGTVREIRALSGNCPVRADTPIRTLENVSTAESIAWLESQLHERESVMEEAVMALSLHADSEALTSLSGLVENQGLAFEIREQALFWLAQSGTEEAFAYLDRLLD